MRLAGKAFLGYLALILCVVAAGFIAQRFFGGGTVRFKPTPGGGQGLPEQYRAAYYYEAGVEGNFPDSHFGMRICDRQLIYLAPDFLQNYLTITRRVRSSEPTIGFFVRF